MTHFRSLRVLTILVVGCSQPEAAAEDATPPPTASAAGSTKAPAAQETKARLTTGEIETEDKKKIGFTIALPEGLRDVSDVPYMKEYGKDAKSSDGYTVQVMEERGPRAGKAGFEAMLAEAEKQKATILKKEIDDEGWYVVAGIVERGKKAVVALGARSKGDAHLFCKGSAEGPVAEDQKTSAAVLAAACKSLKIKSAS